MNTLKRVVCLLLLCVSAICLCVGCGEKPEEPSGKEDFTDIVFANQTLDYDGQEHTIVATGIPEGATVEYTNAGPFVLPGSYQVSVSVSAEGYNTYAKTATLTINALNFSGIQFENATLDYNGQGHTIVATGVPEGASVEYTNAGPFVNAGEYNIGVRITKTGYNNCVKTAKLIINKIDFPEQIVFENKTETEDGREKTILVSGTLPQGTQVQYTNNKGTTKGTYNATVVLKNPNYNDKTLTAILTIKENLLNVAKNIINNLMERPDPWSFMPQAFSKDSLAVSQDPSLDFTQVTSVSSINQKFMGKQMYALWEGVEGMDSLLAKFDVVYAVGETIASAYQTFINNNANNYAQWQGTVAGFKVKIVLSDSQSQMLVGNSTFSLELFADSDENIYTGRIQLTEGAILNYQMSDNYLKFNVALKISGVMVMKQVEFTRDEDNVVVGFFHEYTGVASAALKTSALIGFDENYAIVMSAKRETEDLLIKGYEEVYSSKTGRFLAAEVVENNKLVDYDTFWVNLYDVAGINTIKLVENGKMSLHENIHDVYVNGSSNKLNSVRKLGGLGSRKYDIEMKTVYYVVKTVNGDTVEYNTVKTEIPMLFVQNDSVEDFSEEIVKKNSGLFSVTPTLPISKMDVAEEHFEAFQSTLDLIKEVLTYDELVNQLGTKNPFFD